MGHVLSKIGEPHVDLEMPIPPEPESTVKVFYKEVIEMCMDPDVDSHRAGLSLLANESKLAAMLPKLSTFILEEVKISVAFTDFPKLGILLRMIEALLSNKLLPLQCEIHKLLPSVMTCVVTNKLCNNPAVENPWIFRTHAASLLGEIVRDYSTGKNNLQPRVEKFLVEALQPSKPLTTVYGGLVGLKHVDDNFSELVRPHVRKIKSRIKEYSNPEILEAPQLAAEHICNFLAEEGI